VFAVDLDRAAALPAAVRGLTSQVFIEVRPRLVHTRASANDATELGLLVVPLHVEHGALAREAGTATEGGRSGPAAKRGQVDAFGEDDCLHARGH
jgi:hypothetical protein